MKLIWRLLLGGCLIGLVAACSLPPEKPVTRKLLLASGVYKSFQIVESPEELLTALNMEGQVVLKSMEKDRQVYVKILATADGLVVTSYDR